MGCVLEMSRQGALGGDLTDVDYACSRSAVEDGEGESSRRVEDLVGARVGTEISVCLSVCLSVARGQRGIAVVGRWRLVTKGRGLNCLLAVRQCVLQRKLLVVESGEGQDKTLGRCDGAAKWRIRMGVSAVVRVPRS